jgi:hypothetical protein
MMPPVKDILMILQDAAMQKSIRKICILHITIKVVDTFCRDAEMSVFRHICISPFRLGAPHPSAAIV